MLDSAHRSRTCTHNSTQITRAHPRGPSSIQSTPGLRFTYEHACVPYIPPPTIMTNLSSTKKKYHSTQFHHSGSCRTSTCSHLVASGVLGGLRSRSRHITPSACSYRVLLLHLTCHRSVPSPLAVAWVAVIASPSPPLAHLPRDYVGKLRK